MEALQTGWVSMIQFEPSVGNGIFQRWVSAEPNITYRSQTTWKNLHRTARGWRLTLVNGTHEEQISADYVIDATEMGDVAHAACLTAWALTREATPANPGRPSKHSPLCRT